MENANYSASIYLSMLQIRWWIAERTFLIPFRIKLLYETVIHILYIEAQELLLQRLFVGRNCCIYTHFVEIKMIQILKHLFYSFIVVKTASINS